MIGTYTCMIGIVTRDIRANFDFLNNTHFGKTRGWKDVSIICFMRTSNALIFQKLLNAFKCFHNLL